MFILFLQVFVTSGLGGMSGAQAKAAYICGCVGVIAEVGHAGFHAYTVVVYIYIAVRLK